jgi:hypothetical protein
MQCNNQRYNDVLDEITHAHTRENAHALTHTYTNKMSIRMGCKHKLCCQLLRALRIHVNILIIK